MNNLFVSHLTHNNHFINLIAQDYGRSSLYAVSGILLLVITASFIWGQFKESKTATTDDSLFSLDSTMILKGLAIILLLLGHTSQQCIVGHEAIPFRITGNAAVIIFLFVSGVGLAKRYHLQATKQFLFNRVKKLALPVWLSLALFILLNFLLLGYKESLSQLFLNFCGIFWTKFPNSPCWFITYIIFLYTVYFITAILSVSRLTQIGVLFLLPFAVSCLIIKTGSIDHLALWPQYSLVFPAGVVCGLYAGELNKYIHRIYSRSPSFFIAIMFVLLATYWTGVGVHRISHLILSEYYIQLVAAVINPLPFLLFLIFCIGLLEIKAWRSDLLRFSGRYSFEMYLLHFPFMVYYDFFLFRRPLVFYFFVYVLFLILLSVLLQRTVLFLEKRFKTFPVMVES